jgi:uncharacterized protein YcaQ
VKISISMARRMALRRQGLDGQWALPAGKEGVAQAIERLGYVQIDTIAVVQRAHHHVLWARRPDYEPRMLHELLAHDRRVFEWWTHAASYIPMRDYRYYLPRMRAAAHRARTRRWLQENEELVQHVRERIRAEGPLGSADFQAPEGYKRGTWWSWKPAKRALEMLLDCGELMVSERRNFQRLYDLRERVLPATVNASEPDAGEVARFIVRRALGGLGFAAEGKVHWGRQKAKEDALQELIASGDVVSFEIEGFEGQTFYALKEALDEAEPEPAEEARLHLLSPFDNLIIWRDWLKNVFDFDYKLEAYTPAPQRRRGYFALPILWGEAFAGYADCKADRKPKTLIVRQLALEPPYQACDGLLSALAGRLHAFAAFNECERVVVERTTPASLEAALVRELDAAQ